MDDFGLYFTKVKPTHGIQVPGTLKVDIPLIKWQGWLVFHAGVLCVFMACEF